MRGYSVATAALALGVDHKWLDNLLSQNRVAGVTQARQGVQRRLAPGALYLIATAHQLNGELRVPVASALRIADQLWRSPPESDLDDLATLELPGLSLRLRRSEVRARVDAAVIEALEMAPRTRRGRPPVHGRARRQ